MPYPQAHHNNSILFEMGVCVCWVCVSVCDGCTMYMLVINVTWTYSISESMRAFDYYYPHTELRSFVIWIPKSYLQIIGRVKKKKQHQQSSSKPVYLSCIKSISRARAHTNQVVHLLSFPDCHWNGMCVCDCRATKSNRLNAYNASSKCQTQMCY